MTMDIMPELDADEPQAGSARSIVEVRFPDRSMKLAYYNDRFDLRVGDYVYVEGKLEGLRGQVVSVSHNFKIKISDYKRVIGKADTAVTGELHMAGSHFIAFSPEVIPYEKVRTWFAPPLKEEDEYVSGSDETSFSLKHLDRLPISAELARRGYDYYAENRVCYLCLQGTHGRAIVTGTKPYEVEFAYQDGKISGLVCGCYCSNVCKHEFAALLQLREMLDILKKEHPDFDGAYWASVSKETMFRMVLGSKRGGTITLA